MTMGIIEGVLFIGMVGLIWVMLDIFGDDYHTDDKCQESASPDHHYRLHRPVRPSPASEKHLVTVSLPAALIERLRNAAYWTGDRPLVDLVAEAIEDIVNQLEEVNRGAFPRPVSPLKREATTRRALSGPLH